MGSNGNHNPEVAPCSLAIVSTSTIVNLVDALTQEEMIEDPKRFRRNTSAGFGAELFRRQSISIIHAHRSRLDKALSHDCRLV
jgi:hypothetical protein